MRQPNRWSRFQARQFKEGTVKLSDVAAVGLLSLLVWFLFYVAGMRLDGQAAGAAVVICAVAVFAFKWLREQLANNPGVYSLTLRVSDRQGHAAGTYILTLPRACSTWPWWLPH